MSRALTILALLIAGNLALFGALRGRQFALVLPHYDKDGSAFETPPGPDHIAFVDSEPFDYRIHIRTHIDLPPRTNGDRGLDDVRTAIRWVRYNLRTGDDFHAETWWLRDILVAARRDNRKFMCDAYSRALSAMMLRLGYTSRIVTLGGHISSEVYLPLLRQWVFADALYDFIATDRDGRPLSLVQTVELRRAGHPVVWMRVEGHKGDDDELSPTNRARLDEMLIRGNCAAYDGPLAFGRLTRTDRARDLIRGRERLVQLALDGQPRIDRVERAQRFLLIGWNLALLVAAGIAAWPARRPQPTT